MSRAFVREPDGEAPPEPLPEIPVPPPPNPVTPRGLALIEQAIADLKRRLDAAPGSDPPAVERLRRELRYWLSRRMTAQLTSPPVAEDEVGFGSCLTVDWSGRGEVVLWIVGEDEADPSTGRIGWRAPVAAALTGSGVGDEVKVLVAGRDVRLRILAVDNRGPSTGVT